MSSWIEPEEIMVPPTLQDAVGGHPLVIQTLVRKGLVDLLTVQAFLDPDCYAPTLPGELPDLEKAASRLERAIENHEKICVWGDYDVDGQTATTLLFSALADLGARVNYHIPVRERESHGVSLQVLKQVLDEGVNLVLTCDTGVSARDAVEFARARGVDVIVTDHHDLPPALPAAYALVNPKILRQGHPLSTLPGVGVAYKLAEELYRRVGQTEQIEQYLDLAALGIVADIAMIEGDTRYLLQRGLRALRTTHRLGLRILMEQAEVDAAWLNEEHIGFVLGPRLNALGRLSDANPVVDFLTTKDSGRARLMAMQIEGLNEKRKLLTSQVFQGVLAQIESNPFLLDAAALVLAHPGWPAGVLGIVASRLVERFNKPVILISSPPGEMARGSARSINGVNITAAIASQANLLASYGGHPMAAGLSFNLIASTEGQIEIFRRGLSRAVQEMLGEAHREPTLQINGYLPLSDLTLDLALDLERLAPFGAGNPPPVLASKDLVLKDRKTVGRGEEHLLLTVEDESGCMRQVIWWQGQGWPLPEGRFDLAYRVRASTFNGERDIQVEWVEARLVEGSVIALDSETGVVDVIDCREEAHPLAFLRELRMKEDMLVWCEGEEKEQVDGCDRCQLEKARVLAIWTSPPGAGELGEVLEQVSPARIYLFSENPGMDNPRAFLGRLTGLVKYALRASVGQIRISRLAAATAQRETAVRGGIAWLEAKGFIRIGKEEDDELLISEGRNEPGGNEIDIEKQIIALLDESAAYRAYFRKAGKGSLINIG